MKKLFFNEIKELFKTIMKRVKYFVPMESDRLVPKILTGSSKRTAETKLDHEGSKRQKTNEEQSAEEEKELSKEELHKLMMLVLVEEVYVKALPVKYPIIDWEVYSEDTRKYWKIIRVENHIEAYQTFDDITLWVELKRLFEPDIDDILWKLQRYMHDPLTWRLYDTCGVHHVSTDKGHYIFMLVEKDYPLTRGILTLMLCNKLQVDQYSEMANELLKKVNHKFKRGLLGIKGFYKFLLLVQLSTSKRRLSTANLRRQEHDMEFEFDLDTAKDVSTAEEDISTAKPVSTPSAAVTTTSVEVSTAIVSTAKDKAIRLQAELEEEERQRIASVQEEEREKYYEAKKARLLAELINQRKRYFATQKAKERNSEIEKPIPESTTRCSKRDAEEELVQESSKRQKTGESSVLAKEPKDKEEELS
ncbi:hypothetical protein Tco_0661064 [Tanacetum coccineum]